MITFINFVTVAYLSTFSIALGVALLSKTAALPRIQAATALFSLYAAAVLFQQAFQ